MTHSPDAPLLKHLDCIKDPRRHNTRHLLHDMLLIALCAIISGADSWVQVAEYGRSKIDWFKELLKLPNGIPSHDTFGRLFARINSKGFHTFFPAGYESFPNLFSSPASKTSTIAKSIREHWGIENGLHWCLDISFREDHCRVRKDHAPENFGILGHMAINLLKREKSLKAGTQTKRLNAAWDHDYLLKILGCGKLYRTRDRYRDRDRNDMV